MIAAQRPTPTEGGRWDAAVAAWLGALVGGAALGGIESLYLLATSYGTRDYSGLLYALLLYGALGLVGGVPFGALQALRAALGHRPMPARSWTLSFLLVFVVGGLAATRYILRRDHFAETNLPPTVWVGVGLSFTAFAGVFYVFAKNALSKTFFSFLLRPLGSGGLYIGLSGFAFLFALGAMLNNRDLDDVQPRPVAPDLRDRPNVLVVVVDTLRADALSTYGADGTSPETDLLADDSIVFEQAFSHAPWTRPAVASLLTSRVPCNHGCERKADILPDEAVTLAEALQHHGYTTGAFVDNIHLSASFNFHQGYDTFEFLRPAWPLRASEASFRLAFYGVVRMVVERYLRTGKDVDRYYRDAEFVTKKAIQWLDRHGDERWFLTVHYMDPHDPYFVHPYDGTGYARVEHPRPAAEEAPALRALYEGEVRFWDEHFGHLLDALRDQGLYDDTVIVVTADHGEEFGEHGGFWHGNKLHEETLRVPLILKPPAGLGRRPARIADVVRHIDVAPTVLELAGAEVPDGYQGVSLFREYELRQEHERRALATCDFEGFLSTSIRDRDWRLIHNVREGAGDARSPWEMYLLAEDEMGRSDLFEDPRWTFARDRLTGELEATLSAACAGALESAAATDLGPAACEQLRALGYTEAAARCDESSQGPR